MKTSWVVTDSLTLEKIKINIQKEIVLIVLFSQNNIYNKQNNFVKITWKRLCQVRPSKPLRYTHYFWIAYIKLNRKSGTITDSNIIFDKSDNTELSHCASSQFHTFLENRWVFPHLAISKEQLYSCMLCLTKHKLFS